MPLHPKDARPTVAPLPCVTAQRLSRASIHTNAISFRQRVLEPELLRALDAVPADCLPHLRVTSSVGLISRAIEASLQEVGFGPSWLAEWLTDDIVFLARLFQELVETTLISVRLEGIDTDGCRRFHTDNVRFRLVTTYRGPGTEWIVQEDKNQEPDEPSQNIQRMERGCIAIMRGRRDPPLGHAALLHRSPPISGTGVTRLFLAIDDAADHVF